MASSSSSSLTIHQVLSPPAKQIGEGNNQIIYVPTNQIVWQCTFSQNGQYLAACYGGSEPCVRIWEQQQVTKNSKSTAGRNETSSSCNWELHTVLSGVHERTIRSISFAPIHQPVMLASASFDGTIAIWEQQQASQSHQQTEKNINNKWICSAQLEGHENEVKCVVWNTTGSLLASCGRDKTVWVWECYLQGTVGGPATDSDFECLAVLNGHQADIKCVMFAPSYGEWGDGDEILLSGSYDDTIKCWAEDAGDWYCAATIASVHTSTIWALALAPSGTRFISGSADGILAIYKAYTESEKKKLLSSEESTEADKELARSSSTGNGFWKCVGTIPNVHHQYTIYSLSYASTKVGHCRLASGGGDNAICIWRETDDSTSDQPKYALELNVQNASPTDINCVCWHPTDGSVLASASDDGTVRIWNYQQV